MILVTGRSILAVVFTALMLTACSSSPTADNLTPTTDAPGSGQGVVVEGAPAANASPISPDQIQTVTPSLGLLGTEPALIALQELEAATGIPAESIQVVDVIAVQWPDSSMGCPQPGQAIVDTPVTGYLVTALLDALEYRVHVSDAGNALVCFSGENAIGASEIYDPIVTEFIRQVRFDLAQAEEVALEDIELITSEPAEWSDSRLGCEDADDGEVINTPTSGYRIVLRYAGEEVEYHTSYDHFLRCVTSFE